MGRWGDILFDAERELDDPVERVVGVLTYCEAERVGFASRTIGPERGWEEFLNGEDDGPTEDWYKGFDDLREAAKLYRPGRCLDLSLGRNKLSWKIWPMIREGIPENIAGDFGPSSISIRVGWHDLFEVSESEDGQYFGRSFFTFAVSGPGSPLQWQKYRELIFEVPGVKALKGDLEKIVGPLKQIVCWSV